MIAPETLAAALRVARHGRYHAMRAAQAGTADEVDLRGPLTQDKQPASLPSAGLQDVRVDSPPQTCHG